MAVKNQTFHQKNVRLWYNLIIWLIRRKKNERRFE